jgi:hypothetical protein
MIVQPLALYQPKPVVSPVKQNRALYVPFCPGRSRDWRPQGADFFDLESPRAFHGGPRGSRTTKGVEGNEMVAIWPEKNGPVLQQCTRGAAPQRPRPQPRPRSPQAAGRSRSRSRPKTVWHFAQKQQIRNKIITGGTGTG